MNFSRSLRWIVILLSFIAVTIIILFFQIKKTQLKVNHIEHTENAVVSSTVLKAKIMELSRLEVLDAEYKINRNFQQGKNIHKLTIPGKAFFTVDFNKFKVRNINENKREMEILIPLPSITTVNLELEEMEVNQSITTFTKIKDILFNAGYETHLLKEALKDAENQIRNLANTQENLTKAKQQAEKTLTDLVSPCGWTLTVFWQN